MEDLQFEWTLEKNYKPIFGMPVVVWCRIYGKAIYTYERLDPEYGWGNWHDGKSLGVLPPVYWSYIPNPPKEEIDYSNLPF